MEKKFKHGLVLGKFMPCTTGHLHLINTAVKNCDKVSVMICSDDTQPIPGKLRYGWLREIYAGQDNVTVIWCQDENPQYPHECPSLDEFYNKYWVPSVYSRVRSLDVVFTSEEYGDEFAEYLGVKHELVDLHRTTFDISATRVRSNPYKYWEFIPVPVRRYYTKKIVVMGPESTGKSTLVKNLAKHFNTNFVEEFGRTYVEAFGTDLKFEDFETIASIHKLTVDSMATLGQRCLFVDTEAMTTKIFGEMYVQGFKSNEIEQLIKEQDFDLYLLCDVDVTWIQDNTRLFEEGRKSHLERIKVEFEAQGLTYTLISGDWDERLNKAIKAVESIFD